MYTVWILWKGDDLCPIKNREGRHEISSSDPDGVQFKTYGLFPELSISCLRTVVINCVAKTGNPKLFFTVVPILREPGVTLGLTQTKHAVFWRWCSRRIRVVRWRSVRKGCVWIVHTWLSSSWCLSWSLVRGQVRVMRTKVWTKHTWRCGSESKWSRLARWSGKCFLCNRGRTQEHGVRGAFPFWCFPRLSLLL